MKDWFMFLLKDFPSFVMWLAVIGLVIVAVWVTVHVLGETG